MPDFASRSDARTSCVLFPIDETMPIPVTTTRLIEKRSSADPFPWRGFILRSRGQRYPIGRAKARRLPLGCRGRRPPTARPQKNRDVADGSGGDGRDIREAWHGLLRGFNHDPQGGGGRGKELDRRCLRGGEHQRYPLGGDSFRRREAPLAHHDRIPPPGSGYRAVPARARFPSETDGAPAATHLL